MQTTKIPTEVNICKSQSEYLFRNPVRSAYQQDLVVQYEKCLYCPSRNRAGIIATGEIRQNVKFVALESWGKILSIKQLRKKKIPKDNLT